MYKNNNIKSKQSTKKYFNNLQSGFTLIEVMIVVVIISILAAVAVPSYQSYILRSKRADATNKLTDIANQQLQYFMDNRVYGTLDSTGLDLPQGDCAAGEASSEEGLYCISIDPVAPSNTYELIATPQGGQASDSECATITYDSADTKDSTGGGTKCWGN